MEENDPQRYCELMTYTDTGRPTPPGHPSAPHTWKLDVKGRVDCFVLDVDFDEGWGGHNGPGCTVCNLSFCEHCHNWWATPCLPSSITGPSNLTAN